MPAPKSFEDMWRELRNNQQQMRQFMRNPFANSGIRVTAPGQFTVDGSMTVTGDFIAEGKISNDALTNPVRGDSAYVAASGFGVTTTGTTPLASESWFTPAGFTTANILIVGRVFAYNSTGSLDYLYARSRVYIPSTGSEGYGVGLPLAVSASGGSGLNQSPVSIKVLNLAAGQEIRLQVQGWTNGANWASNAGNTADVAGQIIWTR